MVSMSLPAASALSAGHGGHATPVRRCAACGYDLLKTVTAERGEPEFIPGGLTGHDWGVLATGFAVSFVVALGVIAWFMAWVRRRGFVPFAIYRILLGGAVTAWALGAFGG